jgi:hypothetical protein
MRVLSPFLPTDLREPTIVEHTEIGLMGYYLHKKSPHDSLPVTQAVKKLYRLATYSAENPELYSLIQAYSVAGSCSELLKTPEDFLIAKAQQLLGYFLRKVRRFSFLNFFVSRPLLFHHPFFFLSNRAKVSRRMILPVHYFFIEQRNSASIAPHFTSIRSVTDCPRSESYCFKS